MLNFEEAEEPCSSGITPARGLWPCAQTEEAKFESSQGRHDCIRNKIDIARGVGTRPLGQGNPSRRLSACAEDVQAVTMDDDEMSS